MSKIKNFMIDLYEVEALEAQLRDQLEQAKATLSDLFNKRESLIRPINKQRFDLAQYRLDDLQQTLSDISEELLEIAPSASVLETLIAP